jgi:hypothetical protein
MRLIMGVYDPFQYPHDASFSEENDWYNLPVILPEVPQIERPDQLKAFTEAEIEEAMKMATINNYLQVQQDKCEEPLTMGDVIYYGHNKVAGYIVGKLPYAHPCLYALAALDKRFQSAGNTELPSISLEDDYSLDALFIKKNQDNLDNALQRLPGGVKDSVEQKKRQINHRQNVRFFAGCEIEFYALIAEYLFAQLTFKIPAEDCRLILAWEWS